MGTVMGRALKPRYLALRPVFSTRHLVFNAGGPAVAQGTQFELNRKCTQLPLWSRAGQLSTFREEVALKAFMQFQLSLSQDPYQPSRMPDPHASSGISGSAVLVVNFFLFFSDSTLII